jgi:hypothetical protein
MEINDTIIPILQRYVSCSMACLISELIYESINYYIFRWTPWTEYRPIRATNHLKKESHIHAPSGIRTHDPSAQEAEDITSVRPPNLCDRS